MLSQGKFPTACGAWNMNPEDTLLFAAGSFIRNRFRKLTRRQEWNQKESN
jgi:hypothetical protein